LGGSSWFSTDDGLLGLTIENIFEVQGLDCYFSNLAIICLAYAVLWMEEVHFLPAVCDYLLNDSNVSSI
jgi:hypothetical protein